MFVCALRFLGRASLSYPRLHLLAPSRGMASLRIQSGAAPSECRLCGYNSRLGATPAKVIAPLRVTAFGGEGKSRHVVRDSANIFDQRVSSIFFSARRSMRFLIESTSRRRDRRKLRLTERLYYDCQGCPNIILNPFVYLLCLFISLSLSLSLSVCRTERGVFYVG